MTTNNPYGYTKDIENQINLIKDESAKNVISTLYKYASSIQDEAGEIAEEVAEEASEKIARDIVIDEIKKHTPQEPVILDEGYTEDYTKKLNVFRNKCTIIDDSKNIFRGQYGEIKEKTTLDSEGNIIEYKSIKGEEYSTFKYELSSLFDFRGKKKYNLVFNNHSRIEFYDEYGKKIDKGNYKEEGNIENKKVIVPENAKSMISTFMSKDPNKDNYDFSIVEKIIVKKDENHYKIDSPNTITSVNSMEEISEATYITDTKHIEGEGSHECTIRYDFGCFFTSIGTQKWKLLFQNHIKTEFFDKSDNCIEVVKNNFDDGIDIPANASYMITVLEEDNNAHEFYIKKTINVEGEIPNRIRENTTIDDERNIREDVYKTTVKYDLNKSFMSQKNRHYNLIVNEAYEKVEFLDKYGNLIKKLDNNKNDIPQNASYMIIVFKNKHNFSIMKEINSEANILNETSSDTNQVKITENKTINNLGAVQDDSSKKYSIFEYTLGDLYDLYKNKQYNLIFSKHIKTVFYDKDKKILRIDSTDRENVEINIPEDAKRMITVLENGDSDFCVIKSYPSVFFSSSKDITDYNTIDTEKIKKKIIENGVEKEIQEDTIKSSSHGTYATFKYSLDDWENEKYNLVFSLHVKTAFFDKDNNLIKYIYTPSYPQSVEIKVPENAAKLITVFHREDRYDKFAIVKCKKTNNTYFDDNFITDDAGNYRPSLPTPERKSGIENRLIYAKDLGFKGDGEFDNSNALLGLEALIENNSDNKIYAGARYTIVFDSGVFLFEKPHINFLSRKIGNSVFGIDFVGQGYSTYFKYEPDYNKNKEETDDSEHFFIYNSNKFASIAIRDIRFEGSRNQRVSFCKQVADPYPQSVILERITFVNVANTFELKASDCNSEFSFINCKWRGYCENVLKGTKPGVSAQMLNYWFINPDFQCLGGNFVNLEMGGNVSIMNGNFIHKSTDGKDPVAGGTFFKLGGDSQQLGICRFLCIGARFECYIPRKSNIIESSWGNNGSITFISCDDTAKTYDGGDYLFLNECIFHAISGLPSIKFENCMLHGKHVFDLSKNEWSCSMKMNSCNYDGCIFGGDLDTPYDFINIIKPPIENPVIPAIRFTNLPKKFFCYENTCYKEKSVAGNTINKKYAVLKNQRGLFPISEKESVSVSIPANSIITGIILYAPSTYSNSERPNDVEIYIGKDECKKTLLRVVGKGSTESKVDFDGGFFFKEDDGIKEKNGLNYKVQFNKNIVVDDNTRIVTFKRIAEYPGKGYEDQLVALLEYI